jgi:3-oxoacyl-[acyl-carrier protein] reductase
MKLKGRVALVTGGSRGIGKAIARRLLEDGARVAFCARDAGGLEAAAFELGQVGPDILPVRADVSEPAEVDSLVARTLERFARIDICVNNAGIYGPIGPMWTNDPERWRETLTTNLFGGFLVCRYVIPTMIAQESGKIINMSGGGAATPFPRFSAYAVSKAALVRLTETLAAELAGHNIQVNAVSPGFVATRLHQQTLEAGEAAAGDFFHKTREQLATGGVDPAVPADLVAFLASPASAGITGRFFSAVWDNWIEFTAHASEIAGGDLFTLRRIVPADRGLNWK